MTMTDLDKVLMRLWKNKDYVTIADLARKDNIFDTEHHIDKVIGLWLADPNYYVDMEHWGHQPLPLILAMLASPSVQERMLEWGMEKCYNKWVDTMLAVLGRKLTEKQVMTLAVATFPMNCQAPKYEKDFYEMVERHGHKKLFNSINKLRDKRDAHWDAGERKIKRLHLEFERKQNQDQYF